MVVKIPVGQQQFVKHLIQPVWHQQPRSPHSKSLEPPLFPILVLASRLHLIHMPKCPDLLWLRVAVGLQKQLNLLLNTVH